MAGHGLLDLPRTKPTAHIRPKLIPLIGIHPTKIYRARLLLNHLRPRHPLPYPHLPTPIQLLRSCFSHQLGIKNLT
eukprot:3667865-Amphidinium_carterae.1